MFCLRKPGRTRLARRLASEAGAALIEIMLSTVVLGIVSVGVVSGLDVAMSTSGSQKHKAAAANIAEKEIERMRGMRISELTAMAGTPQTVTENGVAYTQTAKAEWVSQPHTGSICEVTGPPTYLRLSVAVTAPGKTDKPVTVTSLLAPGARGTLSTQGALVIRITDSNGNGVGGVPVTLGGGAEGKSTNSDGCVSWSPITSGTYNMSFTKAGYVTPAGATTVTDSISVPGQAVTERSYTYSQTGTITGTFHSYRNGTKIMSTNQSRVGVAHPDWATPQFFNASGSTFSASLPPKATPYTVFAGDCAAARPPVAYETNATVEPGQTASVDVRMPAINAVTKIQGNEVAGTVEVTDVCGDKHSRATQADGTLADPAFPYSSSSINACGQVTYSGQNWLNWAVKPSNGTYRKNNGVTNNNFTNGVATTFDFGWTWLFITVILDSGWNKASC